MEAGLLKSTYNVDAGDTPLHDFLGCRQVCRDIAVQGVLAAVGVGDSFYLLVGNLAESQLTEDRLHGSCRLISYGNDVLFLYRAEAAVNLHVSLKNVVIVEVVGIEVGAREHVVVVGFCRIAGEDEVGSRQELQHGPGRTSHIRVREALVVGGRAFES